MQDSFQVFIMLQIKDKIGLILMKFLFPWEYSITGIVKHKSFPFIWENGIYNGL